MAASHLGPDLLLHDQLLLLLADYLLELPLVQAAELTRVAGQQTHMGFYLGRYPVAVREVGVRLEPAEDTPVFGLAPADDGLLPFASEAPLLHLSLPRQVFVEDDAPVGQVVQFGAVGPRVLFPRAQLAVDDLVVLHNQLGPVPLEAEYLKIGPRLPDSLYELVLVDSINQRVGHRFGHVVLVLAVEHLQTKRPGLLVGADLHLVDKIAGVELVRQGEEPHTALLEYGQLALLVVQDDLLGVRYYELDLLGQLADGFEGEVLDDVNVAEELEVALVEQVCLDIHGQRL